MAAMQSVREGLLKIVVDALQRAPQEQAPLLAWSLVCGVSVDEFRNAQSNLKSGDAVALLVHPARTKTGTTIFAAGTLP